MMSLLANSTLSYWSGVIADTYLTSSVSSSMSAESAAAAAPADDGPGSGDAAPAPPTGEGVCVLELLVPLISGR